MYSREGLYDGQIEMVDEVRENNKNRATARSFPWVNIISVFSNFLNSTLLHNRKYLHF